MNCVELTARYDARASFYGKAQVMTIGKKSTLLSYGTDVAEIRYTKHGPVVTYADFTFSQTTNRHIREFIRQYAPKEYSKFEPGKVKNISSKIWKKDKFESI